MKEKLLYITRTCILYFSACLGRGGAEKVDGVLLQTNWREQQLPRSGPFFQKKPLHPPRGTNSHRPGEIRNLAHKLTESYSSDLIVF